MKQKQEEIFQVESGLYKEARHNNMKEKHETREATDGVEVLTMVADILGSRRTATSNSVTVGACWRRLIDRGLLDLGS